MFFSSKLTYWYGRGLIQANLVDQIQPGFPGSSCQILFQEFKEILWTSDFVNQGIDNSYNAESNHD